MTDRSIDVVFLDAGGVLVCPNEELIAERFAAAGFEVDPTLLFAAHFHGVLAIDTAQAEPEVFDDYHLAYSSHLGLDPERIDEAAAVLEGLWAVSGLWRQPLPWAAEGLAAIAATGVPIVVVSNADGTVADVLGATGLLQVGPGPGVEVVAIVDSGAVGVAKPDPAIFHLALEIAGTTADRAIHVGDAYQYDVRGARAAGVRPILVDPLGLRTDADCERVASLVDVAALID
ncbi:HAD family hydrolase [Aquihabitans sp. McL0605]|uniref:HAD family hydrolase n=1 Tax=Aquihabitans sp. McL0605 TaxID=3415671 RepID=UPI003CE83F14